MLIIDDGWQVGAKECGKVWEVGSRCGMRTGMLVTPMVLL